MTYVGKSENGILVMIYDPVYRKNSMSMLQNVGMHEIISIYVMSALCFTVFVPQKNDSGILAFIKTTFTRS